MTPTLRLPFDLGHATFLPASKREVKSEQLPNGQCLHLVLLSSSLHISPEDLTTSHLAVKPQNSSRSCRIVLPQVSSQLDLSSALVVPPFSFDSCATAHFVLPSYLQQPKARPIIRERQTLILATTSTNDPSNGIDMASGGAEGQAVATGNEAATAPVVRQSTVVVRKKLPWLDGPQHSKPGQVPGQYGFERKLACRGCRTTHLLQYLRKTMDRWYQGSRHRPWDMILRSGLWDRLRPYENVPDLETSRHCPLSSRPRAGIKPAASKEHAMRALGMVDETHQGAAYTPSEYSGAPSSEKDDMPSELHKQHTVIRMRGYLTHGLRPGRRAESLSTLQINGCRVI